MTDAVTLIAPPTSRRAFMTNPFVAGTRRSDRAVTAMPTGMFTTNTECQPNTLVRIQPKRTPTLPPPDETEPTIPIAFVRFATPVQSDQIKHRPVPDAIH